MGPGDARAFGLCPCKSRNARVLAPFEMRGRLSLAARTTQETWLRIGCELRRRLAR